MANVRLNHSLVLDKLVKHGGVIESDAETIRREDDSKDQVREIMSMLPDRGPSAFGSFVKSLKDEYPSIAKKLEDDEKSYAGNVDDNLCTICKIKSDVKPKDVIDRLYTKEIVNNNDSKTILKCSQEKGWVQLQCTMNKNPVKSKAALVDALNTKYPDLSREYATVQRKHFKCFCHKVCSSEGTLPKPQNISSSQWSSRSSSSSVSSSSQNQSFRFYRMNNIEESMQTGCKLHDAMENDLQNGQLSHSEKEPVKIPKTMAKYTSLPNNIRMTTCNEIKPVYDQKVHEYNSGIYEENIPFQIQGDTGTLKASNESTNDRSTFNRVAVRRKKYEC